MKKLVLLFVTLFMLASIQAQDIFKQHGVNKEVLTLSKGKYKEVFTNDEVVQIGTVLINTRNNEIIKFLEEDDLETAYKEEYSSRFLTIDPMAEKYPQISPYVYCNNNPVNYIDPDGRNPVWAGAVAIDVLLVSTGVVSTGIVLSETDVDQIISDVESFGKIFKEVLILQTTNFNPGLAEQRKREREAKEGLDQNQANVSKSIDTNVSGTMPNGDPAPKRDPNDGGKNTKVKVAVAAVGMGAASVKSIIEGTEPQETKTTQEELSKQSEIKSQEQPQNNSWWQNIQDLFR